MGTARIFSRLETERSDRISVTLTLCIAKRQRKADAIRAFTATRRRFDGALAGTDICEPAFLQENRFTGPVPTEPVAA